MDTTIAVELGRKTLETAIFLALPVLLAATMVSLVVNIGQVLTSLQEVTIASVPRLLSTGGAIFLLLPWMIHRLSSFTVQLLQDFRPYLR